LSSSIHDSAVSLVELDAIVAVGSFVVARRDRKACADDDRIDVDIGPRR